MSTSTARVILVPGLLGFERLGPLRYFNEVEPHLRRPFEAAGIDMKITVADPPPTAPIEVRAAQLIEQIAEVSTDEPLHLVGHSTGGIDCRVVLSPGVSLPTRVDVESVAGRFQSAVTLCSPHYGAPMARATTSVSGHRLLSGVARLLATLLEIRSRSRIRLIEPGKIALHFAQLAGVDREMRERLRVALTDAMQDELDELQPHVLQWLGEIGGDSTLLEQLTPQALSQLRADLRERPGVRLGSVVVKAPPPRLAPIFAWRTPPYARATASLYQVIYRVAGSMRRDEVPELTPQAYQTLRRAFGELPDARDNDGMVPTLSQVWGHVIAALEGDHLDLMGYYGGRPDAPRLDMLFSGAKFEHADFAETWEAVGRFMVDGPAAG